MRLVVNGMVKEERSLVAVSNQPGGTKRDGKLRAVHPNYVLE